MRDELTQIERVERAKNGDLQALEHLIVSVQHLVYNLAVRMLHAPRDAEDATQEILIKVITHLSAFRGDSAFTTWVYRIAANYLLTLTQRQSREQEYSFERLGAQLERSLAAGESPVEEHYDAQVLAEEVRRSCTLGMLLCLNREQRIAVILGDIFELSSEAGADILGISQAAFRKRLSRGRAGLVAFVSRHCGIVNPANPCRCTKHIGNKIGAGRLHPERLEYATTDLATREHELLAQRQELTAVYRTGALLRSHPHYTMSDAFITSLRSWLHDPSSRLLENTNPTTGRP